MNSTEIKLNKVKSDLSNIATYNKQSINSKNMFNKATVTAGYYVQYTTGNLVANASYSASDYISVIGNTAYSISGYSSQGYAWYDSNKVYISGANTPGANMVSPANAAYIRITVPNPQVNVAQLELGAYATAYTPFLQTSNSTPLSTFPLQVYRNGTLTRIAWKYDALNDFWLDFDKLGQSSLYQIGNMWLLANSSLKVNSNLTLNASQFLATVSDWVGPYNMKAVNNINGTGSAAYTGGWHGYNGDQTGAATARNVSYAIYADNVPVLDGATIGANTVKIVVVNRIQANNTTLVTGSGREVLEEIVTYTITQGKVDVEVRAKALEDITVTKYMGLQTNNSAWNTQILFEDDITSAWQSVAGLQLNSGTLTSNSYCNSFLLNKNNDYLHAWVDGNYGLGRRAKIGNTVPRAYTETYGKAYMNLIYPDTAMPLSANSLIYWRGGYKFYRQ